jgi:hypothetical protein
VRIGSGGGRRFGRRNLGADGAIGVVERLQRFLPALRHRVFPRGGGDGATIGSGDERSNRARPLAGIVAETDGASAPGDDILPRPAEWPDAVSPQHLVAASQRRLNDAN